LSSTTVERVLPADLLPDPVSTPDADQPGPENPIL
jgi:hypothetical protein